MNITKFLINLHSSKPSKFQPTKSDGITRVRMYKFHHFYPWLESNPPCDGQTQLLPSTIQHDVLLCHCFLPFLWCKLNGLQLFLRLEQSQKTPEARACWSHNSNASSSSSIISASKSHGNLHDFDRWVFSRPTMFTWKLGRWVLGLQAIPCIEQFKM
jgi:hypothetical protein